MAHINPQNDASRRILEKQGFVRMPPERETELNQWEAQAFEWWSYALPTAR
jgi:RimJ/RimL family protein N-acetyltransferase